MFSVNDVYHYISVICIIIINKCIVNNILGTALLIFISKFNYCIHKYICDYRYIYIYIYNYNLSLYFYI